MDKNEEQILEENKNEKNLNFLGKKRFYKEVEEINKDFLKEKENFEDKIPKRKKEIFKEKNAENELSLNEEEKSEENFTEIKTCPLKKCKNFI